MQSQSVYAYNSTMGISERKERQKAELRETILSAARQLFSEEGSQAMTMRRIAEAIEYSPATIYLHFASREHIALALVAEGFAKLVEAFGPALTVADPVERIMALATAYVGFGLSDPQTYKLIFMQDSKYLYSVLAPAETAGPDAAGEQAFGAIVGAVAAAVGAGAFRPVDPPTAAQAVWAGLHGVLSLYITCPVMIADPSAAARLLVDTLVAGLRQGAPGAP